MAKKPDFAARLTPKNPQAAYESMFAAPSTPPAPVDGDSVVFIPLNNLVPFKNHTFDLYDGQEMEDMVQSIREIGVQFPILVRPTNEPDRYEIIAGHNRVEASKRAGLKTIKAIINDLDDDEATIVMVQTNFQQRQKTKHSEKARSYKALLEAMNRQGKRTDLTSGQPDQKLKGIISRDVIAEDTGVSAKQIQRYIRLTYLNQLFLDMVDKGKLAFGTAVAISYLQECEQLELHELIEYIGTNPPQVIANVMKEKSKERVENEQPPLNMNDMNLIWFAEGKPKKKVDEIKNIKIPMNLVRDLYPEQVKEEEIAREAIMGIKVYYMLREQDPELLENLLYGK